jgi:hypothetical protein
MIRASSPDMAQQVLRTSLPPPDIASVNSVNTSAGSASVSIHTQTPKKRIGMTLGLVALLGMAGIGYFIARELVFARPREPGTPTIAASPPPSTPPTASEAIDASPPPSVSASATPSVAKPKPKVIVKPPTSATAAPPSDCDPPYTFDSNGMKKYKPHCL